MVSLTADQERTRERVERVIRLMAPALDAILAVGDRISRSVGPEDYEYYPARLPGEVRSSIGSDPGESAGGR